MQITLNFSSSFIDLYEAFLERERIDPDEEYRYMGKGIFDRWLEFDFGFDDFDDIAEIKSKVEKINESICKEYSANSISKNFYTYLITLSDHSFSSFYQENKSNRIVDWKATLIKNFTDSEILENYSEHFFLNTFIQNHKDWNTNLVRKYCSEIDDLRDILSLNVDWDVETLDFVLDTFTVNGKIKRPQHNDWNKDESFNPKLTLEQLNLFQWNSDNLSKYLELITDEYDIDCKKFISDIYLLKEYWSLDELILFKNYIEWGSFVATYKFIDNDFLTEFKNEISPRALLANEYYRTDVQFIKDNISSLQIVDITNSGLELDINLFKFLEDYYKSKTFSDFFQQIIKAGKLSEDLVIYLEHHFNKTYTETTYRRKGSWDDGEYEIQSYTYSYWKLLAKNSKMVWTDKLLHKFSNKLGF